MTHLYVNSQSGLDDAVGTQDHPMKTLYRALEQAQTGAIVHLAPGTYGAGTGEIFPLRIGQGVRIIGDPANQGEAVCLQGSGTHTGTIGTLQVTVILEAGAELRGVTIENPQPNGTGVWIDNQAATLRDCTVQKCSREGVLLTGKANGRIEQNRFLNNGNSGLTLLHQSRAEVRNNTFESMRCGVAIGGESAPLLWDNRIQANQVGIAITSQARPVLRQNRVEQNTQDGIVVNGSALPDLGQPEDPGGNVLRQNQRYDLYNATSQPLQSVGNWVTPVKLKGTIALRRQDSSRISSWAAVSEEPLPAPAAVLSPKVQPITIAPLPDALPFMDINKHWAVAFIVGLQQKGIIKGFADGSFKPDHSLTRAEYAALLAQSFQLPLNTPPRSYSDVDPAFWAASAIEKVSRMGFLVGFPDGSFRPQQYVSRLQVLVSLVSGLKLRSGPVENLLLYDDRAQIPSYALPAICSATQQGLVVNYPQPSQLNPLKFTTRGETAVMLYQALVLRGQLPAIPSTYLITVAPDRSPNVAVPLSPVQDLQNHPSEPFVRGLMERGIIRGFPDGSFQPDRPLTRAAYAAFVTEAFSPPARKPEPTFTDIPDNFWAKKAIVQAIRGGFLAGGEKMAFRPQEPVLRYQVLHSLVQGLRIRGTSLDPLRSLPDREQIPPGAQKTIAAALEAELIPRHTPGTALRPMDIATRGDVAMMIYQGLVYQQRLLPIAVP